MKRMARELMIASGVSFGFKMASELLDNFTSALFLVCTDPMGLGEGHLYEGEQT